jgi:Spy/CpxP family protein refolding chaperone
MKKFVIALVVAATPAIVFAQTAGTGTFHHHGQRGGFHQLGAKLNLTDAQKQQMKDIRTADRESNKQLNADFRAKFQEFRALKQANDPGAADVKAQLEAMRPQIQAARKASREAMLNVLTPDQRAQLKAARQSRGFGSAKERGQSRGLRGAVAEKLNLTDAQKTQLKQLRETSHQQNEQLFADARAKRQELRSLTEANDPRASEVKAQLEALRPQLKAAREQQHTAFLNVLTPEQRTQLEQWKAQRQAKRHSSR